MSADLGERRLRLEVPQSGAGLNVHFKDDGAEVTIPEDDLKHMFRPDLLSAQLEELKAVTSFRKESSAQDAFSIDLLGSYEEIARSISKIFRYAFNAKSGRHFDFTAYGDPDDLFYIQGTVEERFSWPNGWPKEASTSGKTKKSVRKMRFSLFNLFARLFFWPIPFIATFLIWGLQAAALALLVMTAVRLSFAVWEQDWTQSKPVMFAANNAIIIATCATTAYLGTPLALQLAPSLFCILCLASLAAARFIGTSWFDDDKWLLDQDRSTLSNRLMLVFAAGLLSNEFLRQSISFDTWIWIFAFFRLELMAGFLAAAMPVIWRASERSEMAG